MPVGCAVANTKLLGSYFETVGLVRFSSANVARQVLDRCPTLKFQLWVENIGTVIPDAFHLTFAPSNAHLGRGSAAVLAFQVKPVERFVKIPYSTGRERELIRVM